MTWDVIQDASGALQLIEHGSTVPEGWTVVAETCNPAYLNQTYEVPQSITRAQAIGALILSGLDDDVQPAIDAIENPMHRKLAQNDWDNRLTFERDNPTLIGLAAAMGMSESDLDQLFIQAAQL